LSNKHSEKYANLCKQYFKTHWPEPEKSNVPVTTLQERRVLITLTENDIVQLAVQTSL